VCIISQLSLSVADALGLPNGATLWKERAWIDEDDEEDLVPMDYLGPVARSLHAEQKV
jgi:hypothetical protein